MNKPKACPFCGSELVSLLSPKVPPEVQLNTVIPVHADGVQVICYCCLARGPLVFIEGSFPLNENETKIEGAGRHAILLWNQADYGIRPKRDDE